MPQSGLALVGALLQHTKLRQRIDALDMEGCARPGVKHGDVAAAAIGLLCLGKSDYNDIAAFRDGEFSRRPRAGKAAWMGSIPVLQVLRGIG